MKKKITKAGNKLGLISAILAKNEPFCDSKISV
jgi:hypothetical protein